MALETSLGLASSRGVVPLLCPATSALRLHLSTTGHLACEPLTLCRKPVSQGSHWHFCIHLWYRHPLPLQPTSALPPKNSVFIFFAIYPGFWSVVWVSCCLTQDKQFRKAVLLQAGEKMLMSPVSMFFRARYDFNPY